MDTKIVYRKHLGLAGFAFALTHLLLSWGPFMSLFKASTWASSGLYPVLAGATAMMIFSLMALISNQYSALALGGKMWRGMLRLGYPALLLVAVHITLLKYSRWMTWAEEGFTSLPSMSLLMTLFIMIILGMRIALEVSLRRQRVS